ncbi:hypothetical protein CXB51_028713 [Gossypium anomalum]|uniref:Uncharacterized protein n=1 Tax=Gossypium anomalum TaxID=47600 RepID=A0A8J5YCZ6_9ROSI|nr:hypothetical protein CXB51_028713 [Gossypium anomalum]
MLIFNSSKHFAAYYAFPHLWVPSYPPGSCYKKTRNGRELSLLRHFGIKNAGFKNDWLPFFDPYCPT